MSSLSQQLHADLPAAMKAGDRPRVAVLRTTLAAIANAEAVDPARAGPKAGLLGDIARRHLSGDDIRSIVTRERDELRTSAEELRRLNQISTAEELVTRAAILDGYLSP